MTDFNRGVGQFQNLSKEVSNYLSSVYYQTVVTLMFWACGFQSYPYLQQYIPESKLLQFFCLTCLIIPVIVYKYQESYWKNILLYTIGYSKGLFIGDLVSITNKINPDIVNISLTLTIVIFSTLSLLSLNFRNRFSLYLGGILFSCLNCMVIFNLFQYAFDIFPLDFVINVDVYFGILLFCIYVFYDTQKIIYDANRNDKDSTYHALTLFIDFINIFIRLLVHMIKSKKDKKN